MLKILTETGLSYKVGIMTVSSPFVVKLLAALNWIDVNITQIGLWFSVLLTITLILGHFLKMIWHNKKKDLENEELRLKVELLKIELKNKQEEQGND